MVLRSIYTKKKKKKGFQNPSFAITTTLADLEKKKRKKRKKKKKEKKERKKEREEYA